MKVIKLVNLEDNNTNKELNFQFSWYHSNSLNFGAQVFIKEARDNLKNIFCSIKVSSHRFLAVTLM